MKKIAFLFISLLTLISCGEDKGKPDRISTKKVSFTKEGSLHFVRNDDTLKTVEIEFAEDSYEQQTGLMYRKSMKENRGMLFVYESERPRPNFYMKNTEFSLDLIYINADKEVVDFNENAQPRDESPLPSDAPSQYVLEVNGGKVQAWNLRIGDAVIFRRIDGKN